MDNLKVKAALMKKLLSMADDSTAGKISGKVTVIKATPIGTDESQSPIRKESGLYDLSCLYTEAARKSFDLKPTVLVATTENIELRGIQKIDGVKTAEGDRVLVKNQNKPAKNGIYVVSDGNWTRSVDADDDQKLRNNMFTYVEEGNVNGGNAFSNKAPSGFRIDQSPLTFEVFRDKTPAKMDMHKGSATFSSLNPNIEVSQGINDMGGY